MQCSTLCVVKRTRSVQNGMRRGAPHDIEIIVHAPAWECSS
ncbi:hydrogenase expression protein [Pseudomonas avellanae]|uniref:Hydrogenase expression protein n=1 Tax=Pseudomonas avellanae TaxID=46257 RepID=A0A261WDJ4_9PSED|nr:hydrogenase expression protein [Pseudomonas syringae pv. actinidiae]OZI84003.1 hydrogenase expression protein [Pseudomonas avellanae]AQX68161.1 hydrogenase expression protein [Pseudomonas syringae pv. actinidiae]PHZ42801.1 hydrogenase expression protein [Pseudomonas syringae pv. actinidiae]PIB89017.1 hydrogenase expression protein [Pseudomonas syringae pv. actinidiae]